MSNREAARRALDIINNLGGSAEEFRRKWLTLHAFSTKFERNNQRHTLIETIEASIPKEDAEKILKRLNSDIIYLSKNPVGDLRFDDAHPQFYQNARQDIAQACLEEREPSNRLGHLVCVVYQVRCNTEHGRKKLGSNRSQRLFNISNKILDEIIQVLLREAEAA